jgi:hypothetical protein
MSKLSGQARPEKMDTDVRIVRPGSAGQTGHGCPNCLGRRGRAKWTSMSELSGQARPDKIDIDAQVSEQARPDKLDTVMSELSGQARADKLDMDVRIVQAGSAEQNGN